MKRKLHALLIDNFFGCYESRSIPLSLSVAHMLSVVSLPSASLFVKNNVQKLLLVFSDVSDVSEKQ